MSEYRNQAIARLQGKSLGLGVVLTLIFGGLGLFYTSIGWGIVGLLIEAAIWLIGIVSLGILLPVMVPIWHVVSVIICIVSINNHNRRIIDSMD